MREKRLRGRPGHGIAGLLTSHGCGRARDRALLGPAALWLCILLTVAAPGFAGGRLRGDRANPWLELDSPAFFREMFLALAGDTEEIKRYRGKDALLAEARALLDEFHHWDLDAPAHRTDGWSDFQEAEWPFMAVCYTGFGLANVAEHERDLLPEAGEEMAWMLKALRRPALTGFMAAHFGEAFPEHGEIGESSVFVHGHYLYLGLRYRESTGRKDEDRWLHKVARALARDFERAPIRPSYRDMYYVSDNLSALAALRRYDRLFKTHLSRRPVERFLREIRLHYLHPATGMICTYVDPRVKGSASGPRGIGVMYGQIFLAEVDERFARDQWDRARQYFIRPLSEVFLQYLKDIPLGYYLSAFGRDFRVSREHPDIPESGLVEKNTPDGDSGPVVFGVGVSATGFAVAAARKMEDHEVAQHIEDAAVFLGGPRWEEDRLYYRHMFHPVGQAVVFFGKSLSRDAYQASER